RLYLLSAWRESSLYTPAERAALAWTESLTLVSQTGAPDADYDALRQHFSDHQIVALTLLITTINAWNRLAIGFRSQHPTSCTAPAHVRHHLLRRRSRPRGRARPSARLHRPLGPVVPPGRASGRGLAGPRAHPPALRRPTDPAPGFFPCRRDF